MWYRNEVSILSDWKFGLDVAVIGFIKDMVRVD